MLNSHHKHNVTICGFIAALQFAEFAEIEKPLNCSCFKKAPLCTYISQPLPRKMPQRGRHMRREKQTEAN